MWPDMCSALDTDSDGVSEASSLMVEPSAELSFSAAPLSPTPSSMCLKDRRQRRQRLHSLHCYIAQPFAAAVAVSAAMLVVPEVSEGASDASTTPSGRAAAGLRLAVDCAAVLRDTVVGVASAIGKPPRRPFEEQDGLPGLLWMADLSILCCLASLVFFAYAFMPQNCMDPSEEEPSSTQGASSEGVRGSGRLRVLAVVWLSVVSGGALNIKHPLRSALLCGF